NVRMAFRTLPFPGPAFHNKAPNLHRTRKCNRIAESPADSCAQARSESGMRVRARTRAGSVQADCRAVDAADRMCSEDKRPDRHGPTYKRVGARAAPARWSS